MSDKKYGGYTVAELRRLNAERTQGEWISRSRDPGCYKIAETDSHGMNCVTFGRTDVGSYWPAVGAGGIPTSAPKANADCIAAAVNSLGPLLDEVDRLRAALQQIVSGKMPCDLSAGEKNAGDLCAGRLCGIARKALGDAI